MAFHRHETWRRFIDRAYEIVSRIPRQLAENDEYWAHYRHRLTHAVEWLGDSLSFDGKPVTRNALVRNICLLLEADAEGAKSLQRRAQTGHPWRTVLLSLLVSMGEIRNGRETRVANHGRGLPRFSLDDYMPDFLREGEPSGKRD